MPNRRRDPNNGWEIIILFVLAVFSYLTIAAVRELLKPNTDAYRPIAPDIPRTERDWLTSLKTLPLPHLIGASLFFGVCLVSFVLLRVSLVGQPLSGTLFLLTLGLVVLTLGATLLVRDVAPYGFAAAGGATFLLCLVLGAALLPHRIGNALTPLLVMGALSCSGFVVLWTLATTMPLRLAQRAWVELGALCSVVLLVVWLFNPASSTYLIGLMFILTFFGAAFLTTSFESDRAILYLFPIVIALAAGLTQMIARLSPATSWVLVATVILATAAVMRTRAMQPGTRRLSASYFTTPVAPAIAPTTIALCPPKAVETIPMAEALIVALLNTQQPLSLSMSGNAHTGIAWQLASSADAPMLERLAAEVRSHVPGTQAQVLEPIAVRELPFYRQVFLFGLVNDYAAPLPFVDELRDSDPLTTLTNRMAALEPAFRERMTLTVQVTTASLEAKDRALRRLVEGKIRPLAGILRNPNNPTEGLNGKRLDRKLNAALYHCFVALVIESADRARLDQLSQGVHDLAQFDALAHNRLVVLRASAPLTIDTSEAAQQDVMMQLLDGWKHENDRTIWQEVLVVLSPAEIAALWHLPDDAFTASAISWATTPVPNQVLDAKDAVQLGVASSPCGGSEQPVYLKYRNRNSHHYIAGKTDTGKSTLLQSLIQQDIGNGYGVAVIDPHQELIDNLLQDSVPASRANDVILLDCSDTKLPVPINPFRIPDGVSADDAYNYVMFALTRIYADIWLEGQTELYFKNTIRLLLTDPEATPLDIARVFEDDEYRTRLLNNPATVADLTGLPMSVRNVWKRYGKATAGQKAMIANPINNRTHTFWGRSALELMTCNPNTVDFRQMIRDKKIVLINLKDSGSDEEVNSLATMFLSGFLLAASSLRAIPKNALPRYYVYVDEVERVTTAPIDRILLDSRKFGLALILANQVYNRIPPDIRSAITGNVGVLTVFEVGMDDARLLAHEFEPDVSAHDLTRMGLHRIAVKLRSDNQTLPTFQVDTRLPPKLSDKADQASVRDLARSEFLRADDVRKWLNGRYGDEPSAPAPKNGDNGSPSADGGMPEYEPLEPDDNSE